MIVHRLVDRELAYQAVMELQVDPVGPAPAAALGMRPNSSSTSSVTSSSNDTEPEDTAGMMPQHLPQLLVTRSEKLCSKLSKEVAQILAVSSGRLAQEHTAAGSWNAGGADSEYAAADDQLLQGPKLVDAAMVATVRQRAPLPDKFTDVTGAHYPLVLPVRQLIDMLNASLPEPFKPGAPVVSKQGRGRTTSSTTQQQGRSLLSAQCSSTGFAGDSDDDDNDDKSDDFDADDLALLDAGANSHAAAAAGASSSSSTSWSAPVAFAALPGSSKPSAYQAGAGLAAGPGTEVDFDLFLGQYWGRFDARLTRDLDPSMVFAGARVCCCYPRFCRRTRLLTGASWVT